MNECRKLCGEIRFGDPGFSGEPLHGPIGGVAVHPFAVHPYKDRPRGAFTDVEIERGARGMVTCLPPLRTIFNVR
jgi:hypothetical protein